MSATGADRSRAPVVPRRAATVVLVRDGEAGPEVLLLERSAELAFVGGAAVFPGGAVDPVDEQRARALFATEGWWRSRDDGVELLAAAIAAVRECAEEAGIFLVRRRDAPGPSSVSDRELLAWRRAAARGPSALLATLDAASAEPDVAGMVPFARWVTPEGSPRRFDTWFFAARAPSAQAVVPDRSEIVRARWLRPTDALVEHAQGSLLLVLPTRTVLARQLSGHRDAASLLQALRGAGLPETVRPRVVETAEGERLVLPWGDEEVPP